LKRVGGLELLFFSEEIRSALVRGTSTADALPFSTRAEFSPDGAKLYVIDQAACDLLTYDVTGFRSNLAKTQATGSCGDFKQVGGLLYFDSGVIYDQSPDKN
jgi:hypothetical protein